MKLLTERYRAELLGVLSCYERNIKEERSPLFTSNQVCISLSK